MGIFKQKDQAAEQAYDDANQQYDNDDFEQFYVPMKKSRHCKPLCVKD